MTARETCSADEANTLIGQGAVVAVDIDPPEGDLVFALEDGRRLMFVAAGDCGPSFWRWLA